MDEQMQDQAPVAATSPIESSGVSGGIISRPWEATVLGILDVIGTIFAFLLAVLFVFLQGALRAFFSSPEVAVLDVVGEVNGVSISGLGGFFGGMMVAVGVFFVFLGILGIFMTRGVFKGQKWSPIATIVLSILAMIAVFTDFTVNSSVIVALVVSVLMIFLSIMCVRHPYFGPR